MSTSMYGNAPGANGQAIFTDDVSLQVFMEHLKRLVSFSHYETNIAALPYADYSRRLWALKRTDDQQWQIRPVP